MLPWSPLPPTHSLCRAESPTDVTAALPADLTGKEHGALALKGTWRRTRGRKHHQPPLQIEQQDDLLRLSLHYSNSQQLWLGEAESTESIVLDEFLNAVSCEVPFFSDGTKGLLSYIPFRSFIQKPRIRCLGNHCVGAIDTEFAIVNNKPVPYLLSQFSFCKERLSRKQCEQSRLNDQPIRTQVLDCVGLRFNDVEHNSNCKRIVGTSKPPLRIQPIRRLLEGSFTLNVSLSEN